MHKVPAESGGVKSGVDFEIIRHSFGLEVEVVAGVQLQWWKICLACVRFWVLSLALIAPPPK